MRFVDVKIGNFSSKTNFVALSNILIVRDESDEDNCKMMVMKDNYNKKISPFKFDYVNQMIKPVDVNVSFAVIDVLSTREVDLVYVLKFRFLMEYYDYRWDRSWTEPGFDFLLQIEVSQPQEREI